VEILYFLIPLSLLLLGGIVWIFLWAVRSRQFEDLEGPAYRILMDDDEAPPPPAEGANPKETKQEERKKDKG
jgi:cbb3-type cytochrome oxidase maturation protein